MDALNPTRQRLLQLCRMDRTWVRGEGVWLQDAEGRRFLDCYAQYGAVALGHNAPAVTAAVRAALEAAEPAMVQPYRAPHAEALADNMCRLAPGNLTRCVFTSSGAEAVEAAIKLVRARTGRPLIVAAHGSFHGKTLAALAATGQPELAEDFGPLPSGFLHVPFGDAAALADLLARDGDRVAAVLLEPIQGERGVHLPPRGYFAAVRQLCDRYGAALVLDEVQTGLGRTGRLFACEHEGIEPDVLLLAKALGGGLFPLGACLCSAALWDERFALRHSSTFANNNVACRVGRAVLDALTEGGLCREAARKGERLLAGLGHIARRYPRVVAAVRGRGLLCALELRPATDGAFLSFLHYHGLYAYAVAGVLAEQASVLALPTLGERPVLRVAPPLVITDAELDLALIGIESVCEQLDRNSAHTLVDTLAGLPAGEPREDVFLPAPRVRLQGAVTYAFILHPTRVEDLILTNPGLERLTPGELEHFSTFAAGLPAAVVLRAPPVRSRTGAVADGLLICLPMLPEEMARRGLRRVSPQVAAAVDLAARCGARVVGLGGHTTAYSRRGLAVVGRGPAVTTGNALTAGMAFAAVCRLARRRGLDWSEAVIAVVGAGGSVGSLCARLVARSRPRRLLLGGNPVSRQVRLHHLRRQLDEGTGTVHVAADLDELADCDLLFTASGAGQAILDDVPLRAGTIVCDIARPPDVSPRLRQRGDLTVIDGGLVALPAPRTCFGPGNLLGLPDGVQLACLSETILLALEGDRRDHGIGDDVPVNEVDYMLSLARRHGFRLAPLPTRGREPQALCSEVLP
jgi:acetylornithine/succinyldiaminopimelate/putrescine aminotransferase/predicted amino acid dehydrogenase